MQRPDVPPHLCHKLTQTSTEATRYVQLCPVSDRLSDLSALSSALGGTASKPLSSLQLSHRLLITGGTFIPKGGEDVAAQQSWQCPGRDGPVEPLGKEGDGQSSWWDIKIKFCTANSPVAFGKAKTPCVKEEIQNPYMFHLVNLGIKMCDTPKWKTS